MGQRVVGIVNPPGSLPARGCAGRPPARSSGTIPAPAFADHRGHLDHASVCCRCTRTLRPSARPGGRFSTSSPPFGSSRWSCCVSAPEPHWRLAVPLVVSVGVPGEPRMTVGASVAWRCPRVGAPARSRARPAPRRQSPPTSAGRSGCCCRVGVRRTCGGLSDDLLRFELSYACAEGLAQQG